MGFRRLKGVTRSYMGFKEVTEGYKELEEVRGG